MSLRTNSCCCLSHFNLSGSLGALVGVSTAVGTGDSSTAAVAMPIAAVAVMTAADSQAEMLTAVATGTAASLRNTLATSPTPALTCEEKCKHTTSKYF